MTTGRFRHSAGAVTSIGLHLVGCPKYSQGCLERSLARRLESLLVEIAAEHGWTLVAFEVMADHVDVFARVHPSDAPSEVARAFKALSSRLVRQELPTLRRSKALISTSYFVTSVGCVSKATVKRYIEHQWDKVA